MKGLQSVGCFPLDPGLGTDHTQAPFSKHNQTPRDPLLSKAKRHTKWLDLNQTETARNGFAGINFKKDKGEVCVTMNLDVLVKFCLVILIRLVKIMNFDHQTLMFGWLYLGDQSQE